MAKSQDDVVWTIKVDKKIDDAVQVVLHQLGYKSKAELTREAIREFLIRRKLFSLLGGEPTIPKQSSVTSNEALNLIITKLKSLTDAEIEQEVHLAREEVAKEFLDDTEE